MTASSMAVRKREPGEIVIVLLVRVVLSGCIPYFNPTIRECQSRQTTFLETTLLICSPDFADYASLLFPIRGT